MLDKNTPYALIQRETKVLFGLIASFWLITSVDEGYSSADDE